MKICGIVCEYNPFHSGHAYHIAKTREISNCDYIVCAMSGNFMQRGEPAIFDKFSRARMALSGGADLVAELPFCYSVRSAEHFAKGSVALLAQMGATHISFGVERSQGLEEIANILLHPPAQYTKELNKQLSLGLSFPSARQNAVAALSQHANILSSPNCILAIEYIKAIKTLNVNMEYIFVPRKGAGYNDQALQPEYSSATALREALAQGIPLLQNIPAKVEYPEKFVTPQDIFAALIYKLRTMSAADIAQIYEVSEGLENRIVSAAQTAQSYEQLISLIKTKRYVRTKLARILIYILFDITKTRIAELEQAAGYVRVLGIRKNARELLCAIGEKVVTTPPPSPGASLGMDIIASDVYAAFACSPSRQDYFRPLIVL